MKDDERIRRLLKLTKGWYTVAPTDSGLIINDLRFGLADGWVMDKGNFVFAYPVVIEKTSPNNVVDIHQRRNTFDNADELLAALWLRILGRTT